MEWSGHSGFRLPCARKNPHARRHTRASAVAAPEESGGLAGTRTPDQCLKRALLYQLSYQPNLDRRGFCEDSPMILSIALQPAHATLWLLCRGFCLKMMSKKHRADNRATLLPQGCRQLLSARIIGRILCLIKARRQAVSRPFRGSHKTRSRKLADRRWKDLRAIIGRLKISPGAKLHFEPAKVSVVNRAIPRRIKGATQSGLDWAAMKSPVS